MSIVKKLAWDWIGDRHAFGYGAGHSYEILFCSELPGHDQPKKWRGKNLGYESGTTNHLGYEWFDTKEQAMEARNSEHERRILSALTADPRAMVASALERAAEACKANTDGLTHYGPEPHHIDAAAIRSLITEDHAAALEALVQERSAAMVAAAYADAAAAMHVPTMCTDETANGFRYAVRSRTPADAQAHLDRLISEAEARGYQRGQEEERESAIKDANSAADMYLSCWSEDYTNGFWAGARHVADSIRARGGETYV